MTWEALWRGIPFITSLVCASALPGAVHLVKLGERDWETYRDSINPRLMWSARLLRVGAWLRLLALLTIVMSGALFGAGTWHLPPPRREGLELLLWINHFLVGSLGLVMTILSHLNVRARDHL